MSDRQDQKSEVWEQRWHPLREEWVVVAAHRQDRPWSGDTIAKSDWKIPPYVEDCYLCPRNARVSGAINPDYQGVFVFDNDHPCVGEDASAQLDGAPGIYRNRPATGVARVVCYTPRHDMTLAELEVSEVENLLGAWQSQYLELARRREVSHVLIFENKGEVVGVSNPHPHCQIYATNFVFKTIETEATAAHRYLSDTGRVLFADIIESELSDPKRIISQNDNAIAFIPYFARYAYEVFVAPRRPSESIAGLTDGEISGFASVLKDVLVRLDNLWHMSFPYVMALHQAPTDGGDYRGFHFHVEFHPPLRKPNLLKYLAGPEIGGGNFLSDTSPEAKAAELVSQSSIHYKFEKGR